jgi:hypothetical protein
MWKLEESVGLGLAKRAKKFQKSNHAEFQQVMVNFNTYHMTLKSGSTPLKAFDGLDFVRNEGEGLYAIDQTPLRKGHLALRLYVYPCEYASTIYVLQIGTKSQQDDDINECHRIVRKLKDSVAESRAQAKKNDEKLQQRD